MSRRWQCPQCGAGVLAPDRPRKDDVRRYCLDCSQRSGRLVERTCPAAEKQRAAKTAKRAARTATKRERDKLAEDARWSIGSYDVRREAKRIWNLPTMRALPHGAGSGHPVPKINLRHRARPYSTGRASPWHGVTMTAGTDVASALETLLHELLHAALGDDTSTSHTRWHTPTFWTSLRSSAKEAWPQVDFQMQNCPQRGYAIDGYLAARLNHWLRKET